MCDKPRQCSTCEHYHSKRETSHAFIGTCGFNGSSCDDIGGCQYWTKKGKIAQICINCKNYKPSMSSQVGNCTYLNVLVGPEWDICAGSIFEAKEDESSCVLN